MKLLLSLFISLSLSGCIFVTSKQQPSKGKKCPPGHVWSDGKCHNKGKGHDKKGGKGSNGKSGKSGKGSNGDNGKSGKGSK